MELQVTFDLSDRLFALLEDKLPNLGRRVERAVSKELGAKVRQESNIRITVKPTEPTEEVKDVPNIRIEVKPTEVEHPAETQEQQPAEKASPAPIAPEDAIPTLEDCRAALNRARIRFEGEDYNNLESEGRKKYHSALTKIVKTTVMEVSEGKAAKIPDLPEDRRAAFIAEMDALVLDENGNIVTPQAPF